MAVFAYLALRRLDMAAAAISWRQRDRDSKIQSPIINHLRPNRDWSFAVAMKDVHTGGGQKLEDWCSVSVVGQQAFEAARPRQLDNL